MPDIPGQPLDDVAVEAAEPPCPWPGSPLAPGPGSSYPTCLRPDLSPETRRVRPWENPTWWAANATLAVCVGVAVAALIEYGVIR